jgi:para-nitrobenzyl esterase
MKKLLISSLVGGLVAVATLVAGTAAAAPATRNADGDPVVRTADGLVRGIVTDDHRIFQGIPYATPPVGDLRLRAPRPTVPWTGIRDATRRQEVCPQTFSFPPCSPTQFQGAEDCLYLNLHVPRGVAGPMPVMVFLHGGNTGGGSLYDPRPVTGAGQVIVVTINYRLGALGFLRHPSLHDPYAGNFALADQQAALRWVRTNVGTFGGDSRNVTLWGESFGGFSVCAQLASPAARGLFDKAIVQSASCGNDLLTRAEADRRGRRAVTDLGCADAADVAACLRALPVERIAALPNALTHRRDIAAALPWFYTVGTPPLPMQPADAVRAGRVNDVPLIQGGTRDEMRAVVADLLGIAEHPLSPQRYRQIVRDLYGRDAGRVLARYSPSRYATPSLALATAQTDEGRMVGWCSQLPYDQAHRRNAPVFMYEFAEDCGRIAGDLPLGASHGDDIPYFFDSYFGDAQPGPSPAPREGLAAELIARWTAFAWTGRPGAGWDVFQRGNALSLSSAAIAPVNVHREHQCGFWRSLTR